MEYRGSSRSSRNGSPIFVTTPRSAEPFVCAIRSEQDLETGANYEKHNTLIYFASLRHMERAARTSRLMWRYTTLISGMMTELAAASVTPEFVIWAEARVLSRERVCKSNT